MERKIFLLVFFAIISFAPIFSSQQSDEYKQILFKIGAYDVSNIATKEIIPKFSFLLPSIPDSVWNEFEQRYDSVKISQLIEKNFMKFFDSAEIKKYKLFSDELLKNRKPTDLPQFEDFLLQVDSLSEYLNSIDSILALSMQLQSLYIKPFFKEDTTSEDIKNIKPLEIDSLRKFYNYFQDSVLNSIPPYNPFLDTELGPLFEDRGRAKPKWLDSIDNEFRKKLFRKPPRMKLLDSLSSFRNLPFDTSFYLHFNDFRLLLKMDKELMDLFKQGSQLMIEVFKSISDLIKDYIEVFKEWRDEIKQGKDEKALDKKYEKRLKEIEKKYKKREEELKKKFKEYEKYYKEFEKRHKELSSKEPPIREMSVSELQSLFDKHYKFVNSLIQMKKSIEFDILQELKRKGYINEVPQN